MCGAVLRFVIALNLWARNGVFAQQTLYVLSMLTYPDNDTSLQPSIHDAPDLVQGARLAIETINKRTDVLSGFRLELIEADDGCELSWKSIISLLSQLYYSDKQVVGVIGPECSDSTKELSSLTSRPEVALINIHLASDYSVNNDGRYPYNFGLLDSQKPEVDTLIALIRYNNWTRVGVLYSSELLLYQMFQEGVREIAEISYQSFADINSLPLKEIMETHVRIVIPFLRDKVVLQNLLCMAYHMNMTFPNYQWVLSISFEAPNISFTYKGTLYSCTEEQMEAALNKSLSVVSYIPSSEGSTISGLDAYSTEFDTCLRPLYCYALFDAVWALALALNSSLQPMDDIGWSLSNYTYGNPTITNIIQQEMFQLSFRGVLGNVQFLNGGYANRLVYLLQYYNGERKFIAIYNNKNANIELVTNSSASFISSDFETINVLVSVQLTVVVIVADVLAALFVVIVHIVNTAYSKHKLVKASSVRLNHFAYVGCYLVLLATLIYAVMETFPIESRKKAILCKAFMWIVVTGLTLVFGTVSVKSWRLYYIFKHSFECRRTYTTSLKDEVLAGAIVALLCISIAFCLTWTLYDPLLRKVELNLTVYDHEETKAPVLMVSSFCTCTYLTQWIASAIIFESSLIIACVAFALLSTKVNRKRFQTQGTCTVVLGYSLFITSGAGCAAYFMASDASVRYGAVCLVLLGTVYLCTFMLLVPPVLPVFQSNSSHLSTTSIKSII